MISAVFFYVRQRVLGNGIMQSAPTLISTAGTLVMTLYNGIMTNAPKLVDAAVGMITNLGSGLASGIPQFLAQSFRSTTSTTLPVS